MKISESNEVVYDGENGLDLWNGCRDFNEPAYRTCDVRYQEFYRGKLIEKEYHNCLFHQWGLEMDEDDKGFTNYTVGIVETADGTIITPVASSITFTDRG